MIREAFHTGLILWLWRCRRRRCAPVALTLTLLCAVGTPAPCQARPGAALAGDSSAGQAIAGSVLSSADGHGIAGATVTLSRQIAGNGTRRPNFRTGRDETATTDADGRYRFQPQPAGRYNLRASAPGYLPMFYLEHNNFNSAVVTGAGVGTGNLQFSLVPEASLHGRVLDDTGEPVQAAITLYRDTSGERSGPGRTASGQSMPRIRPAGGTQCDDDGRYQIVGLKPGRYYIAASATPWYAVHARRQGSEDQLPYRTAVDPALDVAYPITFYPHATTEAEAVPIVLKTGGRATANLLMQAERAGSLTLQMPDNSNGIQPMPVLVRQVFGNTQYVAAQGYDRDGSTLTIAGIAPGEYSMRASRRIGLGGLDQGSDTPVSLSAETATVVQAPSPALATGDVVLAVHGPSGSPAGSAITVDLLRVGSSRDAPPATALLQKGVARFNGLAPGDYRIRFHGDVTADSGEGTTWTVSRLTVAGALAPRRLLHVNGGTLQADVLASSYAPEVSGVIRSAGRAPHAGSLVVLVPAGSDTGADLFRADQSDLDGSYRFSNVVPGNYLLVAVDGDWDMDWQDAAELMRYLPGALPVVIPGSGPALLMLPDSPTVQQK